MKRNAFAYQRKYNFWNYFREEIFFKLFIYLYKVNRSDVDRHNLEYMVVTIIKLVNGLGKYLMK